MRRVSSLPSVLALILAPALSFAQTSESGTDEDTEVTEIPDGLPAVESTPATPTAASTTPAIRPTPAPLRLESRALPIAEIHGYLRTRVEAFWNFSLGWEGAPVTNVPGTVVSPYSPSQYDAANLPWYRNPDWNNQFCFNDGTTTGPRTPRPNSCGGGIQWSSNMRMRLEPQLHPTEFITIHSQIDIFDNMVLGSTPMGYYNQSDLRSPYAPITGLGDTQNPPTAGYNAVINSIHVKRAWAEVTNQTLGQLRFGRMPTHWGLGILANAGNGYDSDYQNNNDRIMYAARLRPLGLFLAAMWDFPSVGVTSQSNLHYELGQGQSYDLATYDNVHQWIGAVGRRLTEDETRAALSRGELVLNGGLFFVYRQQFMDSGMHNVPGACAGDSFGSNACGAEWIPRQLQMFIPDLWVQLLGSDFRLEVEAVYMYGSVSNPFLVSQTNSTQNDPHTISQFGAALEAEGRLLNNRLTIGFKTGYASGDPDQEGLTYASGYRPQLGGDKTFSTFRFHPDYRIDLIFWRQIMRQVAGAYYFRPSVQYNFIDEPGGNFLFGRVDLIWSRASEFMQTRGNAADLGVEIDGTIQFQTDHRRTDGVPNNTPEPGFYAMIQYGVFFPMGGLGPTAQERQTGVGGFDRFAFQTAHTLRAYLGVAF
jgi:uncharacterized protein (TIGR04551 family)